LRGAWSFNWDCCGTHDCLHGKYSNSVSRRLRGNGRSLGPDFAGGLSFEGSHFAQTPQVPCLMAELGCQKCVDKVPGHHRSHDPSPETDDVHVIILDPLTSRKVIIDQCGMNSCNLVGADRSAYAASTNSNATFQRARGHRAR